MLYLYKGIIMKKCIYCGKNVKNFYSKRCYDCFNKQRIKSKIRCVECNVVLNTRNRKQKRCLKCYRKKIKVENKTCLDCGVLINKYTLSKRCHKCNNIYQWKHIRDRLTITGKNNPAYIHGQGNLPYPVSFSTLLKEKIRKRDNYTCQNCGCKESNHHRANKQIALTVHHIDYNKMNCKENNLITVCNRCNIKANANIDYWFAYYKYQIKTIKETI